MKRLVVGSGLAGLCIAWELFERNQEFTLLVSTDFPASTAVSTGMYNPIVFKRINKSWMIDDLVPVFLNFYQSIAEHLDTPLLRPIELLKRMPSEDYIHLWNKRSKEDEMDNYIEPVSGAHGKVNQAGMLDTKTFMDASIAFFKKKGMIRLETFHENLLANADDGVVYNNEPFSTVILALGAHEAESKLFGWLPFKLCKGEWIRIQTDSELTEGKVVNNVTNIIPEEEGTYMLSSTFSWEDMSWEPGDEPPETLLNNFKSLFDTELKVIDHQAGLRPTVADRRPYLGEHPIEKNIYIFNGLGSKGVMLAPFFAKHLCDHITIGKPLMKEVDITRHIRRFRKDDEHH